MNFRLWPFDRQLAISGEVLSIRLNVDLDRGQGRDGPLWGVVEHDGSKLRDEMRAAIHEHLGPEFDVRSMSFAKGSLEIVVIVGTLFYAVSRYKNFVESIELLMAQLRRVVIGFFESRIPEPVTVTGSWSPGPGLAQSAGAFSGFGVAASSPVVVWYLVISHAAMLTILLWLLVKAFARSAP